MSSLSIRSIFALACAALGLCRPLGTASAESTALLPPVIGVSEVFAADGRSGLALEGFDPVTYRLANAPSRGHADHEYLWKGLVWHFVSEANRAAFMRDPESFAPRIGGYDAERILSEAVVTADPEIFVLRAGNLYLFRSEDHRRRFIQDAAHALQAETIWPRVRPGLVQG